MLKQTFYILTLIILFSTISIGGGVTILPKQIFFDETQKMVPLTVRNENDIEVEISVRLVYSYITTNDTGKIDIIVDSSSTEITSAASWIRPYPLRFILGGLESQTVRLVASPPPDIPNGEYWARIMVRVIPRRIITDTSLSKIRGGLVMAQEVGVPIYYRKGKVSTGLETSNFVVQKINNEIVFSINLTRVGNAAFNGTRILRLRDQEGKIIASSSTSLVVFNNYVLKDRLKIKDVPPGKYTAELEINSKRKDTLSKFLIPAAPLQFSTNIEIQ